MAFALQGKKRGSSYNFKNDVQGLLYMIDKVRDTSEADEGGTIFVNGQLDLSEINRIRRMAGMKELEASR